MRDEDLRRRLLRLRERDQGKLHLGYHPGMERVHVENAEEVAAVLGRGAWPGADEVGEDAAEAAFIVALHAISRPDFQRRCRALLATAVERGSAPPLQRAMLEDRITYNERRPQRYGTIFDSDEHAGLSPWPIAAPEWACRPSRRP